MGMRAEKVYKSFGALQVIRDFNYAFPERGAIAITGKSGSGKTTLMHMLLGILKPNSGLQSADIKIIEMAHVFQLSVIKTARAAYLPAANPYFVSACELSLGLCWKAGIAAEVIGQPARTIGEKLYQAKLFLNTPDLFAWTLAVILLSVALEKGALSALRAINIKIGGRGDGHEG
jgi:ABC-type nitrate/sulfonate/bicarbonate transport system permease component